MKIKELFLVIVLYKTKLEESRAIRSLGEAINKKVNLLVFDNSPYKQYEDEFFVRDRFNIQYHHDVNNSGLSKAYNLALQYASTANAKWLLLLDQDTIFTKAYFEEIEALNDDQIEDDVVAIIPKVVANGKNDIISPATISLGGVSKPIHLESGVCKLKISGINSGTLLKVSFMNSINGFNEKYSLDMLDHWYFNEIFIKHKHIYLMESIIYQDLSVFGSFEENVSIARYKQMINAEHQLNKDMGLLNLLAFKARLCFRLWKQFSYNEKQYAKLTVKYIFGVFNP
ncbi:glycosyltransferase [Pedobacter sp. UC225_61]|uniref:glycosyltransferase n=1 Tax=Pedobacter sp. UC225_61 TaxID=3374623 RepID=UPI00378B818E